MRRPAATILAAALILLPSVPATAAEPVTTTRAVDAAQLRWGLSNEANNRAFAPDTFNHFSAGLVADPGSGGNTLSSAVAGATWSNGRPAGWSAAAGHVSIQKFDGTTYRPTTWPGLSTTSAGAPLGAPLSGTFSNHQIVFDAGTGTVDSAAGTATVQWKGDATVLFYSGMSFFYLSNPRLEVKDGIGTITATLGGYGSSQSDPGAWVPLERTVVTMADLGPVDLSLKDGFTVTPRYLDVAVTGVDQAPGSHFGSFPQSFVDFQARAGAAGFWHSSGGSADQFKQALPLTVSYDAAAAVLPPAPPAVRVPDVVENPIVEPPARRRSTTPAAAPPAVAPIVAAAVPALVPAPEAAPAFQQVAHPVTTLASVRPADAPADPITLWWWLGTAFLTLAAASVAATFAYSPHRGPRRS